MKRALLQSLVNEVFGQPRELSLADVACGLEIMYRHDPLKAAHTIGTMYGQAFKCKEAATNPWQPCGG